MRNFLRLIHDWMDRIPMEGIMQMGPWRMLETGLRGETWTKAIRYFRNSSLLTEEFIDKLAGYLRLHAKRLEEKGGDERLQSN